MAQQSSLRSPCDSSKGSQNFVPCFDRNQGPSPEAACPLPSLFSSSSLCTARDLPTTDVSNCMYLAPLPIQSCYVMPSASVEALLVSLRGRNPHFCCVLQLTTGLQQRRMLPSAPVTAAGDAHEFQLADSGSPCPTGEPHFARAAAGSFADLDAVCSFQTTQSKEPNAALKRTVYVGWIGEFLSRSDEAAFSAAMRLHTSQLCNTKEACSSFVPPHFTHSAGPDICESASTAVGGKRSCSSSFQFIGLSAALCDCYKLQPWEPVQVSFVHLDAIFAAAPHPPLPPLVSNKDYSATSSQLPFSAYPSSPYAACSSAVSSMAPSSGLAAKETLPPTPEGAVDAAPVSAEWAKRPSSDWAKAQSATSAEADNCGSSAAEHFVTAGSEGFVVAATDSSSTVRAHVKAGWYPQLPWDVAPAFVEVSPAAEEDWEVVQLQSDRIEEELLMQIAVVMPSIPFPLWPSKGYERPAKLVAIPKSSFFSDESSNNICEASRHRDNQIRGGHDPPRQRGFRVACGRGSPSIMRSVAVKDGMICPSDRTPTAYREEATGAPRILAATSEPRVSPDEASGAATTSVGAAYPPFVLLSRDTELHVRPFIPKPLGPKLPPYQWTQSFSNSRAACDFLLPAKRAPCEYVGAAQRAQNITAASDRTTEALRTEKSCHRKKNHTAKTSSDTDSNPSNSMNKRDVSSSNRASSSSAKGNYSSSNASGVERSGSTAGARIADTSRADSSHAIRLDWDRKSIAAATDEDKVPAAETPTNTVPSFRMRVVAANYRHLRRPAWVPLLRVFRPGEVTTKKPHADTCVRGKRGGPTEGGKKKVGEEEWNSAGPAAGDSAKQNSLRWEGRHMPGNTCGEEGAVTSCIPQESTENTEMTQEEINACGEDIEDDDEEESLDHCRCHACWMHPCHVVALQKQQPWLQASLRQGAAAARSSLEQRLLNRSTIADKALSKERLPFPVSPPSCACRPSSSASSAGAAYVAASTATVALSQQQSHATAAYVWVSLVVPPERSNLSANKRGGPAARTALTAETVSAAGQGASDTEAGDDSTAVPLAATAAGLFVPTLSSSWKRAALSGLLLLKALPDGRVAPGSVALPLHIRRVYSFPLCSFVFVTPCTSVPTLPQSIFAIPLCPASLSHVGPVAGVVTSQNSPLPARTTASEHVAAAATEAGADVRKIQQTQRFLGDRDPLAEEDENNCFLRVPTLLEHLRTPRGRKDLKDAINKQLQTLAVENSSISCDCIADMAKCAATAGAAPGSTMSLTQTATGAGLDTHGELIYYECSREESAGQNSVFPFALWEGAVLQVPLVLPQSVVTPQTAAEVAGPGEPPAGSIFLRRADTRGRTPALPAASTVSADTVCGITAAKSGAAAAAAALVSMTAIPHSRRPNCSTKTRYHGQADAVKDSGSENQTVQEQYGVTLLPMLRSCMARAKGTTEVFLRKTPGHTQETAWLGCRPNVPAAAEEDAKAPGKSCDFLQGRLTRSGGDEEAVFLDDNVTSMLREGLQDLYMSSSTENNAAAEGEDGDCNSDVPGTVARPTHGRVLKSTQQEVAASEEKQFVGVVHGCADSSPDSDSNFGRSSNRKIGGDVRKIGRGTTRGREKYSKSYRSTCAAVYRSQEVVLRSTASCRSYEGTLTGSPSYSEVRESQAGGPSDSVSQRTRNNCKSRVPTSTSRSNTPRVGSSTNEKVVRRKAGSGGLVNGGERSRIPLHGRKSQTNPADCSTRDERDVQIKEGSSRGFPKDLRTAQAVWAQEALLFEEAVTTEGENHDEETAGDEGVDDEELETEDEDAAADARAGQDKQAMTHEEATCGKEGAASGPLFFSTRERKHPQTSAIGPRHSLLVAVQQEEHYVKEKRSDSTDGKAKSRYATTATDASVASSADERAPLRSNLKRHYVAADSSSDADPSSLTRRSATQQSSMCSSHGTDPPHRRRHGGRPGAITVRGKSPIMRTSRITRSKLEADRRSSLVHMVMLDVVVAFRSVFLPCLSGDVRAAESKSKDAQGRAETQPVLRDHRAGEYPCRDNEAGGARDGITLPQLPADVLPMAISLATQEHPLEFLFHRGASRRARSFAFSRSAPYNVCKDIDSTDVRHVGRSTRSRNGCRSKRDWAGRDRVPPAFVLCDAGFLQKCEQGKIPLQILDPVVLLHASSTAEVASIRAAAPSAASSLSKTNDFEGGPAASVELKRDRKVSESSATDVMAFEDGDTIYQYRMPKDSLIQSSGAKEVARADVFSKTRERKGHHTAHAAGDAATEGGCSSENRCSTTLECGNKPWCISSSCPGSTSTTNTGSSTNITNTPIDARNKRSCFSPCLVLDAEQQSLSYTQWWLCDAVLRSRRAAAAAAAAHHQDEPDRAAAELLHLIQLQCAEQLNPDLLDASAGEVQRYLALASRGEESAVLRPSAKAAAAPPVLQSHPQVRPSHDGYESNSVNRAADTAVQHSDPAQVTVDAAAASAATGAVVASAVGRAPASCVVFLPRHSSAVGKPPTLATHRLVVRDLSFLAEDPAARSPATSYPSPAAARAAVGAREGGGCSLDGAKRTHWREYRIPQRGRKSCIQAATSFLESLGFHRELDEDEEDEDAAAGHNSANTLLLRLCTDFFKNCPAQLVLAMLRRLGVPTVGPTASPPVVSAAADAKIRRLCLIQAPLPALVCGPSGSGRTTLVRAVGYFLAAHAGAFVLYVRCRQLASEAIRLEVLKELFAAIGESLVVCAPSVLVLDDLDALCGKEENEENGDTSTLSVEGRRSLQLANYFSDLFPSLSFQALDIHPPACAGHAAPTFKHEFSENLPFAAPTVTVLATAESVEKLHPLLRRPSLFGNTGECFTLKPPSTPQARLEVVEQMLLHFQKKDQRREERMRACLARGRFLQQQTCTIPPASYRPPCSAFAVHRSVEKAFGKFWWRLEGFSLADYKTLLQRALQRAREQHRRRLRRWLRAEARPAVAAEKTVEGKHFLSRRLDGDNFCAASRPSHADACRRGPELRGTHIARVLDNFVPRFLHQHTFLKTTLRFADVGGLHKAKEDLEDMLTLSHTFGLLLERSGVSVHQGVLLVGPPGCGKTLLAHAVVGELRMRCICVKGPELLSKYIGSSEAAVREVFAKAQQARPCLIFFDEVDALATRRGSDSTGVTDRVVNQMLCQLDGFKKREDVYVLAASSRPDRLDPALLRPGRFEKVCYCGVPSTAAERLEVVKACCRRVSLAPDANLEEVAARMPINFAPADMKAVLQAAHLAAVRELLAADSLLLPSVAEAESPDLLCPGVSTSALASSAAIGAAAAAPSDAAVAAAAASPPAPPGEVSSASESGVQLSLALKQQQHQPPRLQRRSGRRRQRDAEKQQVRVHQRHLLAALQATKPSMSLTELRQYHRRFAPFLAPAYLEDIEALEKQINSHLSSLESSSTQLLQQAHPRQGSLGEKECKCKNTAVSSIECARSDICSALEQTLGVSPSDESAQKGEGKGGSSSAAGGCSVRSSSSGCEIKSVSSEDSKSSCTSSEDSAEPCLGSSSCDPATNCRILVVERKNATFSSSGSSSAVIDFCQEKQQPGEAPSKKREEMLLLPAKSQQPSEHGFNDGGDSRGSSSSSRSSSTDSRGNTSLGMHDSDSGSVERTGSCSSSSSIRSVSSSKSSRKRGSSSDSSVRPRDRSSSTNTVTPPAASWRLRPAGGESGNNCRCLSRDARATASDRPEEENDDLRRRTEKSLQQTGDKKKKSERKRRRRRRGVARVVLA